MPRRATPSNAGDPKIYARLRGYEDFVAALVRRQAERNVSFKSLGEMSSISESFLSHAMGPARDRKFGLLSLFFVAPPLGLQLALVEAPQYDRAYKSGESRRVKSQVRSNNYARQPSMRIYRRVRVEMGRRGAKSFVRTQSPERRTEIARAAAHARWRRVGSRR